MNDTKAIHSFCVPAYGKSAHLEECLFSLKNQTISSNIIITTSTPNEYIQQLADKFSLPCLETRQPPGIGRDWNFSVHSTESPLVTIAHQDDVYHATYTEKFLESHQKYPNASLYFSDLGQIVNGKKQQFNAIVAIKRLLLSPFWISKKIESRMLLKMVLSFGDPIPCGSVMLNKKRLATTFSFNESLKTNLDWLAWLTILEQRGVFVRVPEILYYHRIHSDSETARAIVRNDRYNEDMMMFEKLWGKQGARFWMTIYRLSHLINKVQTSSQPPREK